MSNDSFDRGRFGRLLALIAFVSAVFIITSAQTLDGTLFQLSVFATGAVAVLTAMMGFLIAASSAYEEPRDEKTQAEMSTAETPSETTSTTPEPPSDAPSETTAEDG